MYRPRAKGSMTYSKISWFSRRRAYSPMVSVSTVASLATSEYDSESRTRSPSVTRLRSFSLLRAEPGDPETVDPSLAGDGHDGLERRNRLRQADFVDEASDLGVGRREDRGAPVEREPAGVEAAHLAADVVGGLEHGDVEPPLAEPVGGGQPGDAGADDDGPFRRKRETARIAGHVVPPGRSAA